MAASMSFGKRASPIHMAGQIVHSLSQTFGPKKRDLNDSLNDSLTLCVNALGKEVLEEVVLAQEKEKLNCCVCKSLVPQDLFILFVLRAHLADVHQAKKISFSEDIETYLRGKFR